MAYLYQGILGQDSEAHHIQGRLFDRPSPPSKLRSKGLNLHCAQIHVRVAMMFAVQAINTFCNAKNRHGTNNLQAKYRNLIQ